MDKREIFIFRGMPSSRWIGADAREGREAPPYPVGSAVADWIGASRKGAGAAYFTPMMLSLIFLSPFQMVSTRGLPLNFPERKYWLACLTLWIE